MRANLPQTEPAVLARWEQEGLYAKALARRKEAALFLLHDGPPYANGDIHMGHALNKILKDIIVRYRALQGARAPYVPGWDCHGLPIEYALMKELKVTKHQVDVLEFRRKARAYALKYVDIQRGQFKRLGCWGDWEHPYLTLDPGYVAGTLRALKALVEKGYVYRARKPVNWCWSCETALAEAEVEYESHTSPSIYVKFKVEGKGLGLDLPTYLVIWTTTPWTLMGNVAVAVHPEAAYAVCRVGPGEAWVVAENLTQGLLSKLTNERTDIQGRLPGRKLEGLAYQHPFGLRQGRVVLADYVTLKEGTGLVHTAPGFGAEDYATGKKYGLEVLAPVNARGRFEGLPQPVQAFNGVQVQQANDEIVRNLDGSGHLLKAGRLEHPYPHCWRCHNPIIFRATDQWFLSVEHKQLRGRLLEAVAGQVRWIPPEGKERMAGMLKTRPDWCLSRQRLWGIPIPAVVCKGCGEGILDPRVIEAFARAVEKGPAGSDRWFSEPVEAWLPQGFSCTNGKCRKTEFQPGTDILDVWFDSGVSHASVLERRQELAYPADLYLEGSDQHRGWFQVSLITAAALKGTAPYRAVLTHGFVVDGQGRKMSKSLGNVISPEEVVSSKGADVLRLWVASSDYREDIRLSKEILDQVAETYRKIRNTLRFCLANVGDYTPSPGLDGMERWVLSKLGALVEEVTAAYDECAFHRVVRAIHEFCTVRLSNFYLDVVKDRLYTAAPDDPKRRGIQTALFALAETLLRMLAPLLPITTEEAWAALHPLPSSPLPHGEGSGEGGFKRGGHAEGAAASVHLTDWPDPKAFPRDLPLEQDWDRLLGLRDRAMKALEEARAAGTIRDALEAELVLAVGEEPLWRFLEPRQAELASACIVSALRLEKVRCAGVQGVAFTVRKAPGTKCQRCWMRLPTVGQAPQHPSLCHRCVAVLSRCAR